MRLIRFAFFLKRINQFENYKAKCSEILYIAFYSRNSFEYFVNSYHNMYYAYNTIFYSLRPRLVNFIPKNAESSVYLWIENDFCLSIVITYKHIYVISAIIIMMVLLSSLDLFFYFFSRMGTPLYIMHVFQIMLIS